MAEQIVGWRYRYSGELRYSRPPGMPGWEPVYLGPVRPDGWDPEGNPTWQGEPHAAPQVAPTEPRFVWCIECDSTTVGVHRESCEVAPEPERCPTCRSDVRWKRGRMVFDTPCWDPWHHRPAPLVEGEQG